MSRLQKLDYHTSLRRDQYNPCYGADTLIVTEYEHIPNQFRPEPKDVFPSELCKKVKECEDCPMNHNYKWDNLLAELDKMIAPEPITGLSPVGVF